MTTRLNEGHRIGLRELATKLVDCPEEAKAEDAAYKKAVVLVRKGVEAKYPAADMSILAKYDLILRDKCIRLQLTAGGVEEFVFRDGDAPPIIARTRGCYDRIVAVDDKTSEAVSAWALAHNVARKARASKLEQYRAFIQSATTFEQVIEVWPEASALESSIRRNLPTAVSAETLDAIRADSIRRLKQASKRLNPTPFNAPGAK